MSRGDFLSEHQGGRSDLVRGLCHNVDAAHFGILRIQSVLKKVGNCELVHCDDVKEQNTLQCVCAAHWAGAVLDIRHNMLTEVLIIVFHIFNQCKWTVDFRNEPNDRNHALLRAILVMGVSGPSSLDAVQTSSWGYSEKNHDSSPVKRFTKSVV
jgi:hypothetical protein